MTETNSFYLLNLGCSKNQVDADSMAQRLMADGMHPVTQPEDARVLIVNTCGFIGPARDESLGALRDLAAIKQPGQLLIAAGCLTQRYGPAVAQQVPGIDGVLGTRRWMDVVQLVHDLDQRPAGHPEPRYHLPEAATVGQDEQGVMRVSVQGASAYLKIADGCRRPCAFCAIPLIKGTAVSRPIESILAEANELYEIGVNELILIAQDSTDWGHDLGLKDGLAMLLERLATETDLPWLRVMYSYPGYVTDRHIDVMAEYPQLLPYLDMPLQHGHPATLRRMRRPANIDWVYRTIEKMRTKMPDLALRSTFIVGYPGETDEEYEALVQFVRDLRFDKLGVFTFSFEPGTTSEPLGDPVPQSVKDERKAHLMEVQQRISLEINQGFVGKTLDVLIDGTGEAEAEDGALSPISVGRSYRDAPEIDGLVLVEETLPVGEIVPVEITDALAYDLIGRATPPGLVQLR